MKDNFWIDNKTRAIFTEANVYNANTNLLLLITFVHEIIPTGAWNYYPYVMTVRLYRYVGGFGELMIFFDIIFLIVTLYGIYQIVKSCKNQGVRKYMGSFWNILHTIVTLCSFIVFLITVIRTIEVQQKIKQYRDEPESFISFTTVAFLENLTIAFLGFVLFFTNLEFLRILRFNYQISLMSRTMSTVGGPLASFGMTFLVLFMAYVSLSHCLFVDKLEDFKSMMETFVSLSRMFMGQFDIADFFDNAPYLGPLLFLTYMVAIQIVMINLFVGLICDAYAESGAGEGGGGEEGEDEGGQDDGEKPDIFSFVRSRVKGMANKNLPLNEPIYSDWKDEWDVMMDCFGDRCDNCMYMLRNMEGEETRQVSFFTDNVDEKKKNVLTAIVGYDYYLYDSEFSDGIQVLENKLKDISDQDAVLLKQDAAKKLHNLNMEKDRRSVISNKSDGKESDGPSDESDDDNENGDDIDDK